MTMTIWWFSVPKKISYSTCVYCNGWFLAFTYLDQEITKSKHITSTTGWLLKQRCGGRQSLVLSHQLQVSGDQGMTMMTMEFIYISSYKRIYIYIYILYIIYVCYTHVDSIYTSVYLIKSASKVVWKGIWGPSSKNTRKLSKDGRKIYLRWKLNFSTLCPHATSPNNKGFWLQ